MLVLATTAFLLQLLLTFSFKLKINPGGLLHPCIQPLNLIFLRDFQKGPKELKRYSGRMFYNCSVPSFYITITLEKDLFLFIYFFKEKKILLKTCTQFCLREEYVYIVIQCRPLLRESCFYFYFFLKSRLFL